MHGDQIFSPIEFIMESSRLVLFFFRYVGIVNWQNKINPSLNKMKLHIKRITKPILSVPFLSATFIVTNTIKINNPMKEAELIIILVKCHLNLAPVNL